MAIDGIIFTSQNSVNAFQRCKSDIVSENNYFAEIVQKNLGKMAAFVVGEATEKQVRIQLCF
jgi:uroporphyrinogen-III synthase